MIKWQPTPEKAVEYLLKLEKKIRDKKRIPKESK